MKIKQERKNSVKNKIFHTQEWRIIMKTDVTKTAVKENKKNKMAVLCRKVKENIKNFWQDEDGMGVVEIVLIIVVLIGLVIIFKSQITALVNKLLSKMSSQANKI